MGTLYQVTLPYACFGLVAKDNYVLEAPPIHRWMTGKPWHKVADWIIHHQGTIELVSTEEITMSYRELFEDGEFPACFSPYSPFYDICDNADLSTDKCKKCCEEFNFANDIE